MLSALLILAVGCSSPPAAGGGGGEGAPGTAGKEAAAGTHTGGGAGEGGAQRIVSMSPNVTEILFALGLGDRVVGVDDFSNYPPEAGTKLHLGGFLDPDLEALVSLHPDLAVLLESQASLGRELERLGIPVLRVDNQDLADVEASMRSIARRAGVPQRGEELAETFHRALAPHPVARGERVMITVGRTPGTTGEVLVAGPDSYPYEMVERLGAENVFADLDSRYATVGAEEVVARRSQRIVELHWKHLSAETKAKMADDWHHLLGPDVEVAVVDGPETVVPGPRLPTVYHRLEAALR